MSSSSALPKLMQAITIHGKKAKISQIPLPTLRPTYLLAKVDCIALNPTDWKHIATERAAPNGLSGCDFSGTVVAVGPEVSKTFQPGDRVAGTTHGANFSQKEDGCFAEYAVAKADLLVKIPEALPFEVAATFPLGVSTVGQGLFQQALKLRLPPVGGQGDSTKSERETVLIYGGSTATGSLAVQFAKIAGYRVLATCSPHNNTFVKGLGADAVYDYNDSSCGKTINKDTGDSLKLVWDTISLASSAAICAEALSSSCTSESARYGCILPVDFPRQDVTTTMTFMYTIFNEAFVKNGSETPAKPADFEFAKEFFGITERLLQEGKLKPHPERIGEKGLEGALQGMKEMKDGKVSAVKLVYRVGETPKDSNVEVEL